MSWFKLTKFLFFFVNFVVLGMDPSHASNLAIGNATINHRLRVVDVLVINVRVRLSIFKASSQPIVEDAAKCFFVDVIDE